MEIITDYSMQCIVLCVYTSMFDNFVIKTICIAFNDQSPLLLYIFLYRECHFKCGESYFKIESVLDAYFNGCVPWPVILFGGINANLRVYCAIRLEVFIGFSRLLKINFERSIINLTRCIFESIFHK